MLKEGGFRLGELLGMHLEDLDFGKQGVHVRFRPDNENGARARAVRSCQRRDDDANLHPPHR
jgi:integrase/recombinase XerD